MKLPVWNVTVYIPIYKTKPGVVRTVKTEAHTGPVAEQNVLKRYPYGTRVTKIERVSGYGEDENAEDMPSDRT